MVRVRHYTRVSAMKKILSDQKIVSRDQNRVFVERASARRLSAADAERKYRLGVGKGNACVEFNVEERMLQIRYNPVIKHNEMYIEGNVVDLARSEAKGFVNR